MRQTGSTGVAVYAVTIAYVRDFATLCPPFALESFLTTVLAINFLRQICSGSTIAKDMQLALRQKGTNLSKVTSSVLGFLVLSMKSTHQHQSTYPLRRHKALRPSICSL